MTSLQQALTKLAAEDPKLLAQFAAVAQTRKIFQHDPYPWQHEFHRMGRSHFERLLMAANAVGKTLTGGYETAIHATGLYPDDWDGIRFDHPTLIWVGSISNETQREYTQPMLLGPDLAEGLGLGFIPKDRIIKVTTRQAGIPNVVDEVHVRHVTGGVTRILFKTYKQGWRAWQGAAPHVVWLDEQPDDNSLDEAGIYAEAQTRVLRTDGIIYMTLTPLLGETETIRHFTEPQAEGIGWMGATWDDAPHLSEDRKKALIASYPHWQRDARTKGIPLLGEGAVFPIPEEDITVAPIEIPNYWPQIAGIDFGYNHPFGWARLAHDRDRDVVYVIDCFRAKEEIPDLHVATIKRRCPNWVPHAWPHDGLNTEPSGGDKLIRAYMGQGINLLTKSAHYAPKPGEQPKLGGQPQWPIINDLLERMQTDRFKIFATCQPWFSEYRSYHTRRMKDGQVKIVALHDDTLKASFYAYMMIRFAGTEVVQRIRRSNQRRGVSVAL